MNVKSIFAGLAGLAMASVASAATINYTLSLNDDGTHTATAGSYAVYATTSNDSAGLMSFTFILNGQATTTNKAPFFLFSDIATGSKTRIAGFSFLSSDGGPNLATYGTFNSVSSGATAGVAVYGIGQVAGTLADHTPLNYEPVSTTTNAKNNAKFAVPVLLAVGTFNSGSTVTIKDSGSGSPVAGNVFTGSFSGGVATGNGFVSEAAAPVFNTVDLLNATPEPSSLAALSLIGAGLLRRRRKGF